MTERTTKEINLIYANTHKDYKGKDAEGNKVVMYLCPTTGRTTNSPIKDLPEVIYQEKLAYAQRFAANRKRSYDSVSSEFEPLVP
jgi:hypothetical protein